MKNEDKNSPVYTTDETTKQEYAIYWSADDAFMDLISKSDISNEAQLSYYREQFEETF